MSLTRQHCQEDLSCAYISAVAAKAGFNCGRPGFHDYGFDLLINGVDVLEGKMVSSPYMLRISAKASQNFIDAGRHIKYDLNVDDYNLLIETNYGIPVILVLYCMPSNENEWLSVYEDATTLRYCGYWKSLRGLPKSANEETKRIEIPKDQIFNESSLISIMSRIETGGYP
ncbi:MAG: DUF4365 domain-containing protein [Euryarchaeota archaeon]|nr:DUF4365 domain-containing protein [Euryarchaeota archaeon]